MPKQQPSFSERCALMRDAAEHLKDIAEIVAAEAVHMSAAERRFSERRSEKRKASH
jgi:hypothetical protein